jgi:hypothetical protein
MVPENSAISQDHEGANGHRPPIGIEGRLSVSPPSRFHKDDEGPELRQSISELLQSITLLVDVQRDTNTSWSVERHELIKDVREIKDKMSGFGIVIKEVSDISKFIDGGDAGHLGTRMGLWEHRLKELEDERRGRAREKSRTFWTSITLGAGLLTVVIGEAARVAFEFWGKH